MNCLRIVRFCIFFLLMLSSSHAMAESEATVYIEKGVYKRSAERWTNTAKNLEVSTDSWIWNYSKRDRFHKNNKRDSVLVIPKNSDPNDITLVVWFHGLSGFSSRTFGTRIGPQINLLSKRSASFAVAIPEMPWSINTKTPKKRQGLVWREKGSLTNYLDSVRKRLDLWAKEVHNSEVGVLRVVFVGHSAGGSAIMSAALEGGLCEAQPEHIVWSDASYGTWLHRAWKGCIKSLGDEVEAHIVVRKWDKPHKQAENALRSLRQLNSGPSILYQVMGRRMWPHSKIGDKIFSIIDIFPSGC